MSLPKNSIRSGLKVTCLIALSSFKSFMSCLKVSLI